MHEIANFRFMATYVHTLKFVENDNFCVLHYAVLISYDFLGTKSKGMNRISNLVKANFH